MRSELLAQGAAVDAEYPGRLTLVALREVHDGLEQWPFYLADNEVVEFARAIAIQRREILIEGIFGVFTEWLLAGP
jgi:hypothetical protein